MKVISFKICPFVQRVTALLEAKQVACELEYISLSDKPQWFLDLSPNGQVPLLITDNSTALFESDAIVEYLEEVFPPLEAGVSPETRALNRAWSYLASKHYLVQCSAQRSPDAETLQQRSDKLGKAFTRVEKQLADKPFFAGNAPGMVDIAWLPLLHRAAIIEQRSGYDFLQAFPRAKQWQQQIVALDITPRSVAPDFEEAFAAFYLSDQTWLGRGAPVKDCCFGNTAATDACC